MFGKTTDGKPAVRLDSYIGAGVRVEGAVYFSGSLRIDGEVKGRVEAVEGASDSHLVVSELARIEGPVRVAQLVCNGNIVGSVSVSQSLELQARARIVGDVDYGMIQMHQGAVIDGRLMHAGKAADVAMEPIAESLA